MAQTKSNAIEIVPKHRVTSVQPLGTAKRSVSGIKREIAAAEAGLERANKDFWKASSAIIAKGCGVVKTVTDSRGESFKALRVNPSIRILDAAQKARKIFTKQLEILRAELAAMQAPKIASDDTDRFFDEEDGQ